MKTARIIITMLVFLLGSSLVWAAPQEPDGEWPYYGGDLANNRYSRLTQINKGNVQKLQIAWEWKIGDAPPPLSAPRTFQATPLMIDDVLYFPDPYHRLIAVDAETGKQLWKFDSHMYELYAAGGSSYPINGIARGVASWTDGRQRRIFLAARGQLFAIDAKTGEVIPGFGKDGKVDMTETLVWKVKNLDDYFNSSPPVVFKNLVILGSAISDRSTYYQSAPGDVQAFDARTGRLVWNFHTIPQKGEFGNESWKNDSWKYTGHSNVWPPITVDEKRGLVYLPVTGPASESYGGERNGDNLFSDSVVCLNANTGKRVWHFQTVHHDLWDYDGVMGINLLTIHVDGKTVDAVTAVSKQGFTYVFDRVTGKPVWPIEERPVPQSDVPGEETSATQPFPTKPPPFAQQGFTENDVVDFTPKIKAMALEIMKKFRYGPLFSPPSIQGTVALPRSMGGGADWGGASVDPEKGIIYVRAENVLSVRKIVRDFSKEKEPGNTYIDPVSAAESHIDWLELYPMIDGKLYLNKPPYATITAIDLNKGEILWQQPNGDMPELRNYPPLKGLNLPPTGLVGKTMFGKQGSLVTAAGLLFNGPGDNKLYARDQNNGKILWTGELRNQNPVAANPMTYRTRSGKQFIVVATGNAKDSALVAFALP